MQKHTMAIMQSDKCYLIPNAVQMDDKVYSWTKNETQNLLKRGILTELFMHISSNNTQSSVIFFIMEYDVLHDLKL